MAKAKALKKVARKKRPANQVDPKPFVSTIMPSQTTRSDTLDCRTKRVRNHWPS